MWDGTLYVATANTRPNACIKLRIRMGVCNQYDIQCLERLALAGKEGSRLQLPLMYRNTALELNLGFGHERIYRILKKQNVFLLVQWTTLI